MPQNYLDTVNDSFDPQTLAGDLLEVWRIYSDFPRASNYDPHWIIDNQMGLNALWLTEWLAQGMALREGMRVMDLGCGRALSSIFLAQEYGLQVWATDLWVSASDNRLRIEQAGLASDIDVIAADGGQYMGFVRMIARRALADPGN